MGNLRFRVACSFAVGFAFAPGFVEAQAKPTARAPRAVVVEEVRSIETYPFSDPDPHPMLLRDARLYPYHAFDGYSHTSEPRPWKVVRLENEYIVVYVLPEVGGKVWGAIEKSTGEEFIYRNEVLKFRNIALRGPWTSGGIEFNFGVIGHTPATATPVDHVLREYDDGGVSCVVGALDLPSRTSWRVEIHLPADAAWFETRTLWYNPTPLRQAYYSWMTGAAFARDDLELIIPGPQYLEHSGQARPWPVDAAGRTLSRYDENRFGGHKSYHVVGQHADFFGGYYHDAGYGFGHWAPYEDMPGQKIWLWALSGEGGIWEGLLTDTDGQYVEFQAGRLFVQYAPGNHVNPIAQADFEPYRTDRWNERWFPLKGLGGLSAASGRGALHVRQGTGALDVAINAFQATRGRLEVHSEGRVVQVRSLDLRPMEVLHLELPVPLLEEFEVRVPALDLVYTTRAEDRALQRPFATDPAAAIPQQDRRLNRGRELLASRRYGAAREEIEAVLAKNPWHREALLVQADLQFRAAQYAEGQETIRRALQLDTYDAEANFLAGNLYRAAGDLLNAGESLGWAARSTGYRAAAYTLLGEIALQEDHPEKALRYAERALDYDRHGINALQVQAIAARMLDDDDRARAAQERLLAIDPLHHFARWERYLLDASDQTREQFLAAVGGEFPEQTVLELLIGYHDRGRDGRLADLCLHSKIDHPLILLWQAYLGRDGESDLTDHLVAKAVAHPPAFVFPFRRETIPVLRWAAARDDDWKLDYYLALNLWAVDRPADALHLLDAAAAEPDYGPFYVTRAHLGRTLVDRDPEADLRRAVELDGGHWQTAMHLVRHLLDCERWGDSAELARRTAARFPDNFEIELALARALLSGGELDESIAILDRVKVLPSEMGRTSRQLFESAHLARALARMRKGDDTGAVADLERSLQWPAHLGQGRPFEPEERLQHFLLAHAHRRAGHQQAAADFAAKVLAATRNRGPRNDVTRILALRLADDANAAEAETLRSGLAEPIAAGDPAARWVRARDLDELAALDVLRREHPALFTTAAFRLLEEALDVTAGGR